MKKPKLVGIAGPSCSGKTLLAKSLCEKLKPATTIVLTIDSYYFDLSELPFDGRMKRNFDIPDSLDWQLLESHVEMLAEGKTIEKPVYQFSSHTRAGHGELMIPGDCIIIEGLFALYNKVIRRLLDLGVYISLDDEICLARRIARDMAERGRSRESIIDQYENTVKPMAEIYVRPAESEADVVIDGRTPIDESVRRLLKILQTLL